MRFSAERWKRYSQQEFKLFPAKQGSSLAFKHSGNAGDIIHALPSIKHLSGEGTSSLGLVLGAPMRSKLEHPLGGVMLNRQMYDMLEPLMLAQPYIDRMFIANGVSVDVDLDVFRDSPLPLDRTHIARWYFYFLGINVDLSKPWLHVAPDTSFSDKLVIARSSRYRNWGIEYGFLAPRRDLVFVGLESEYREMKQTLPHLEWYPVNDFLQMAMAIAGSKLFIGNQSFPYALAEGLKVLRILEADPLGPNVTPCGADGYDVFFQEQFEYLVAKLG